MKKPVSKLDLLERARLGATKYKDLGTLGLAVLAFLGTPVAFYLGLSGSVQSLSSRVDVYAAQINSQALIISNEQKDLQRQLDQAGGDVEKVSRDNKTDIRRMEDYVRSFFVPAKTR